MHVIGIEGVEDIECTLFHTKEYHTVKLIKVIKQHVLRKRTNLSTKDKLKVLIYTQCICDTPCTKLLDNLYIT